MIKYILFFIVSSIIVFCTTVYIRLGGYKSPVITTGESEKMFLLSKNHIGAYHKINSVISEVEAWTRKNNVPCPRTFGEYIDNPQTKDEDRLRSEGGCVLARPLEAAIPPEFHYRIQESGKAVLATFDGAPSIGPLKVYPAVEAYMRDNHMQQTGSVFEIYEIHSDRDATTRYIFNYTQP